jgi:SAM-dependent methyltransferase
MPYHPFLEAHYTDGTCTWWHLSRPSPELVAALADGWIGPGGRAIDLGCGLATEAAHLAGRGFTAVGVDLSAAALRRAVHAHPGLWLVRADALRLPFRDARFDVALDRGTFHYLPAADRRRYAAEVARVLRPGGRFLLRACMRAAGVRNDLTAEVVCQVFAGWRVARVEQTLIPSDTRQMPALVARLERPSDPAAVTATAP